MAFDQQTTTQSPYLGSISARTLGEIALQRPGAIAVFVRHKLDYWCEGAVSLAEAAAGRQIVLDDLVKELMNTHSGSAIAAQAIATPVLIDHIEDRFHAVHRRELPELIILAQRVEAVHAKHPLVPTGLADLLEIIETELVAHMEQEEQALFPLMRQDDRSQIGRQIALMRADHFGHAEQIRRLQALTSDFATPDGACATWRRLYAGVSKLVDDLIEHIHTENNILFTRFA